MEKVHFNDIETNTKLLAWSKRKFHTKVMEKIASALALRKVDLSTKVDGVRRLLESIHTLYTKPCDVDLFTQETQQSVEKLQAKL